MSLDLYADKLPEEIRETFKAEIGKYVPVENRDAARELLTKNPIFNAEFQSALSLKHEESMKKFKEEKLPTLLEEEIKKKTSKQPWEVEIDNLRKENLEIQRQSILKERKADAVMQLSKLGLNPELAEFVVAEDETEFKTRLEKLTGNISSWGAGIVKRELERAYSQPSPRGGQQDQTSLEAQYKAAVEAGDVQRMISLKSRIANSIKE